MICIFSGPCSTCVIYYGKGAVTINDGKGAGKYFEGSQNNFKPNKGGECCKLLLYN